MPGPNGLEKPNKQIESPSMVPMLHYMNHLLLHLCNAALSSNPEMKRKLAADVNAHLNNPLMLFGLLKSAYRALDLSTPVAQDGRSALAWHDVADADFPPDDVPAMNSLKVD